jgi:hypothetical protein
MNNGNYRICVTAVLILTGVFAGVAVTTAASAQNPPISTAPQGRRASPPQPRQQQGPDYLAGTWQVEWTGRESPLTDGPRSGTVTFTRQDANTLVMKGEGKTDAGGTYAQSGTYVWHETSKTLTITERVAGGVEIQGAGNWTSPLSIVFESAPVQVKGQTVKLRRVYNIHSAVSFSVVEEIAIGDSRYQRLGNSEFVRGQ